MSFLGGISEADLKADEKLLFKKDEVVEMVCLDHRENPEYDSIILNCKILSGDHKDCNHQVFVSGKNPAGKAQFAKAFWQPEELIKGEASLSRLINRKFSVRASQVYEKGDKKNQYFNSFMDLGEFSAEPENLGDVPF